MPDAALVLTCAGCCCGHPSHGGALAPGRMLRATARRALKSSGLDGRVRLAFTDCLGPCSEANVVFLFLSGRPLWFRRMNASELYVDLFGYVLAAIGGGTPPLPPALATRSFTWTGGGSGPTPPVDPAGP